MSRNQQTLARPVVFVGKGLHSGRIVRMEVYPASSNYGIRFLRTDVDQADFIVAHYSNISATDLCTTIGSGANSVATIEHLMAAFAGLGIDNAVVRLNGPEVPIMDGSAEPFVSEFVKAGLIELSERRRMFVVNETFEYRSGQRWIRFEPARETSFHCEIDFGTGFIGHQTIEMRLSESSFLTLANARTFCHVNEVNALRSVGLALGGSLENAVVVNDSGVMNAEGLRGEDEFVRHKLLDCIGDLYLLGGPIVGKITVSRPGHGFHAEVMNRIMLQKSKYLTVVGPQESDRAAAAESLALVSGVAFG